MSGQIKPYTTEELLPPPWRKEGEAVAPTKHNTFVYDRDRLWATVQDRDEWKARAEACVNTDHCLIRTLESDCEGYIKQIDGYRAAIVIAYGMLQTQTPDEVRKYLRYVAPEAWEADG